MKFYCVDCAGFLNWNMWQMMMTNTGSDHLWDETVVLAVWSMMFLGGLSYTLRAFIFYWCWWEKRHFRTCHEVLSTMSHPKWIWTCSTSRSETFITKRVCANLLMHLVRLILCMLVLNQRWNDSGHCFQDLFVCLFVFQTGMY